MAGYYLHIPFCEKKCSYCDFYSIESTPLMERFVTTLLREIELRADHDVGTITSVFFGGGTPSLLLPSQLDMIVRALRSQRVIAADAEWTMECNPGTVSLDKLRAYRDIGINRLSFGVQSFHPAELAFLERIHTPDDAVQAMELARAAGFTNVNMDLMFALPVQTLASLDASITRLLELAPDHVSAYSLIYEHGTPLYAQLQKGLVTPLDEEVDAEMYAMVMQRLHDAGYLHYEVSNFAQPGKHCEHNLLYWHAEQYVAVGPSAHGYVNNVRYWNSRSLSAWTQSVNADLLPEANRESLGTTERMFERAFLGLRADGLRLAAFHTDFGIDVLQALGSDGRMWIDEGLMTLQDNVLQCTQAGYQVCDEITLRTIAALERASGAVWKEGSPPDPVNNA